SSFSGAAKRGASFPGRGTWWAATWKRVSRSSNASRVRSTKRPAARCPEFYPIWGRCAGRETMEWSATRSTTWSKSAATWSDHGSRASCTSTHAGSIGTRRWRCSTEGTRPTSWCASWWSERSRYSERADGLLHRHAGDHLTVREVHHRVASRDESVRLVQRPARQCRHERQHLKPLTTRCVFARDKDSSAKPTPRPVGTYEHGTYPRWLE